MNVGIFGGSFDPVHNGHIALARYIVERGVADEVWLMVSRRNPLKKLHAEGSDFQRLDMARLAIEGIPGLRVSDFEMTLPSPSYTFVTLSALAETYPQHSFRQVIGSDNWLHFGRWRNSDEIISRFGLIVYPRPGYPFEEDCRRISRVSLLRNAPVSNISSTEIRRLLHAGKSAGSLMPARVEEYLRKEKIYSGR